MQTFLNILLVGGVAYLILAAIMYLLQSRFVYFPSSTLVATPDAIGLPYEEVTLLTSDAVKLSAWFVPAQDPFGVVLFCHGNGGNISHRLETLRLYNSLQLSTLIFDYRGYGASDGTPSEEGTYRDAEVAWRYLVETRGVLPSDIIVIGRSLGGAIAAWLANRNTPGLLVIESGFTSLADIGAEAYPFLPVRLLLRFNYPTLEHLRAAGCPVLVVHSREDEIIPFTHGEALFREAPEPKRFLELHGGHNDAFFTSQEAYAQGLSDFIATFRHHR